MLTSDELDEIEKDMDYGYIVPEILQKEVLNRRLRREIINSRNELKKMISGDIQFHDDKFKQVKEPI
jgi:hypothetical protein